MYEGPPRRGAENEYRRRAQPPVIRRPDRIELWAVGIAIVAMIAAAASAHAGSGGTGVTGGGDEKGTCTDDNFGSRTLSVGDCGQDVKTLHWIMKADSYGASLDKAFDDSTESNVQAFQQQNDLKQSGVVGKRTRKRLVNTMPRAERPGTACCTTRRPAASPCTAARSASRTAASPAGPRSP